MTVSALVEEMTVEELVGWSAFYEIKSEEEQRIMDQAKTGRGARTMSAR